MPARSVEPTDTPGAPISAWPPFVRIAAPNRSPWAASGDSSWPTSLQPSSPRSKTYTRLAGLGSRRLPRPAAVTRARSPAIAPVAPNSYSSGRSAGRSAATSVQVPPLRSKT